MTITLSTIDDDRLAQREFDDVIKENEIAAKEAKDEKLDQVLSQKTAEYLDKISQLEKEDQSFVSFLDSKIKSANLNMN